jgi:hypothetical protein
MCRPGRRGIPNFKQSLIMTIAPVDSLVAEFLCRALADHALGVPELEARARAAGLLGEGQRITHAKVFKRTRSFLA